MRSAVAYWWLYTGSSPIASNATISPSLASRCLDGVFAAHALCLPLRRTLAPRCGHADGRLQSAFENTYVYEDVYMAVSTDDAVIDIGDV